jgi:ATP-dependent protease HslVU (ClpYQ) ATPase subunit
MNALKVLARHFQARSLRNTVVVSPDLGNAKEASHFARCLRLPMAAGSKQRLSDDHVAVDAIVVEDFVRILTEPDASLCRQYKALLATEGVELEFAPCGVRRLAEVAFEVNERTENIGARRLHTVMERLLETVSFDAADRNGTLITVNREYVEGNLGELVKDQDLSRYIL